MKRVFPLLFVLFAAGLHGRVETGLDVLEAQDFAPLLGKRVGVLVNHTAVDARGRHLIELLAEAPGVTLAAIFTPEHGLSGRVEHGQKVADAVDEATGVPVYSLYGDARRPTPAMLKDLDALVCDLPDMGARFYTYITTLGYALEEAARADKEFFVLDRPNPLGGEVVEGLVLSTDVRHFTAYYSIPTRHGLTMGEIARWHNEKTGLNARLFTVPMRGWTRAMEWSDTHLSFRPPSPNIRTPTAALLYAGIGAFESTNVSVGRGTDSPFEIFGAPWMNNLTVARRLAKIKLPGFKFKAAVFVPKSDRYKGTKCYGVRVAVTDSRRARPVDLFVHAACLLRDLSPKDFAPRWDEMPRVVGSAAFEAWFKAGESPAVILTRVHESAAVFREEREPFLIYP
jgi:uncharacterized protein YbbC (DUF1343 family)